MAEEPVALESVNFSTHVMSLASAAQIALGVIQSEEQQEVDLETAKYLIDVLAVLDQKTANNLDETESKLLKSLLYELRVAYVDAQHGKGKPG